MSLTASMEKDRLRDVLQETGLTQYEADTYITLLELGSAAATEIADACDVPQARIYDVLRKLEARGYVETYEDGNLYARAGDPSEVIADLDDYAETIADASDAVQERWERPTVENHQVSVVRPLSAIFDRSREAIEQAETEIQIALDLEQFFNFRDALATAYDRGVHIKLALSPGDNADIDPDELNIDFTGLATEVRYRRLPTPFVVIADRMQIRYAPERSLHPAHEYGVMVNDYSLSRVFDLFFQLGLWETWESVYNNRTDDLPAVYTNIRECIDRLAPLVDNDYDVALRVVGVDRNSGVEEELVGRVTDLDYVESNNGLTPLERFIEQATITLDVDGDALTVGGWGALVEDIEGKRFIIESIA